MLKYGFIILGIVFSFFVFYSCAARYLKIKELPNTIIPSGDRKKYLDILQKYLLVSCGVFVITLLCFLSPSLEIRMILPLVGVFICTYIFSNLSDEIADYDISKKDSDIVQEFLEKRNILAKNNAKENKIKKMTTDEIGNKDDEKLMEETNGGEEDEL